MITVNAYGNTTDKELKPKLMMLHKSFGITAGCLIFPRVAFRLFSKSPPPVDGAKIEQLAANASHFAFYGLLFGLPASGVAMSYLNGRGASYFGLFQIQGKKDATQADKDTAKQIWEKHKIAGQVLEVILPIHIGAVGFHFLKGHNILKRVDPRF